MATVTANHTPTRRDARAPDVFARIGEFFAALRAGYAAAREYEALQHLSDDALARKGLTRPDAMRRVMERNFG
ncbi:MAG: DUF1127 domain-containing protein [Pseudomonadota bacterium]